jgi:flagellar protein FlaG
MMLITAVVASTILITAVFPVVWTMVSTFSSASHETDTRMRTDFKIVTTYSLGTGNYSRVWMKNIGSSQIGLADINKSDVLFGPTTSFNRLTFNPTYPCFSNLKWCYSISETPPSNGYWDPGETIEILADVSNVVRSNQNVYFQFILPNAVSRSSEFTTI